jgi:sugar phosphate isomerase/epimerase
MKPVGTLLVVTVLGASGLAGCSSDRAPAEVGGAGQAGSSNAAGGGGNPTGGVGAAPGGAAGTGMLGGGAGFAGASGAAGGGAGGSGGGEPTSVAARWSHSPFMMDTWFWFEESKYPLAQRVELVAQAGFEGFALSVGKMENELKPLLASEQLAVPGLYTATQIDAYPSTAVDTLSGTGGYVWLALQSSHANSSTAGDAQALELISDLADECVAAGLPGVALYPHVGFWMERVSDAVRLAEQANRPEVRVVFNLYHWMVGEQAQNLDQVLTSAAPHLQFVTLNGSDATAPSILPLNEGNYDVEPVLEKLVALEFDGSVGLQGYSITGDIGQKLQASKQKWDELIAALDAAR